MRFMRTLAVSVAVVLLAAAGACAQDVTLSVAVSLKGVTEELGRSLVGAHPGVALRYDFGASGDLQKQMKTARRSMSSCRPPSGRWTSWSSRT